MKTQWLEDICNKSDIRGICQVPHSIIVDSQHYAFATNGAILCAVKTQQIDTSTLFSHEEVEKLIRFDAAYQLTTLAALREWVGDNLATCKLCHTHGYIECPKCNEGNHNCTECEGEGSIVCPVCEGKSDPNVEPRYGLINDVLLNVKQLARPFHHLEGEQVQVITISETREVYFITPKWRVVIMPLRKYADDDEKAVTFTQWKTAA